MTPWVAGGHPGLAALRLDNPRRGFALTFFPYSACISVYVFARVCGGWGGQL